jgi:hypothetical protein
MSKKRQKKDENVLLFNLVQFVCNDLALTIINYTWHKSHILSIVQNVHCSFSDLYQLSLGNNGMVDIRLQMSKSSAISCLVNSWNYTGVLQGELYGTSMNFDCLKSLVVPLKSNAVCEFKNEWHWCTICNPKMETLNDAIKAERNRRSFISIVPTSPWILFSCDVSDYWRWPYFKLMRINAPHDIVPIKVSFDNKNNLIINEVKNESNWATSRNGSYFWYAEYHRDGMKVTRQGIKDEKDSKVYTLPGTSSNDRYGECHIYSNDQDDVYFVVLCRRYWDCNILTGEKHPSLKPKLFRHNHINDKMQEINLMQFPNATIDDFCGQISQEMLNDENEMRRDEEDAELTMKEMEIFKLQNYQSDTKSWQWIHGIVCPDTGNLFAMMTYKPDNWCYRPKHLDVSAFYYNKSLNEWTTLENWPEGNVVGPLYNSQS